MKPARRRYNKTLLGSAPLDPTVPTLAAADDTDPASGRSVEPTTFLGALLIGFWKLVQWARRLAEFPSDPGVVLAQYREVRGQIPFLYALLIINSAGVTYTHFRFAPGWLTFGCAGPLILVATWRLVVWTFFKRTIVLVGAERARASMRIAVVCTIPLCVVFTVWAMAVDQYGGPVEHAQVAVFTAITVIGCIFCLVHLPQSAVLTAITVIVPFVLYHIFLGQPVFISIALNIAVVVSVMIQVLLNSFSSFTKLILSQASLAAQQAEAERLAADNARLALTDVLTGLPNRRHFFARMEAILAACTESGERFAVGVLDLDRFKPINDVYGHAVGDRLLIAIGERLAGFSRENVFVTRLGGDEFGLIITGEMDRAGAIGQRVCDLLSQPFAIDDHRLSLGCSVGLAIFPDVGTTAHDLFLRADYALYNVKSKRRGGCLLFSADLETRIRSQRSLEAALQTADLERELHVEFQPIVCIEPMKVLGVEALGRWTSPAIGIVEPERFITTAERVGLMHLITLRLFRVALANFSMIDAPIGLSFNLSAHDIVSPDTIRMLLAAIDDAGVDPKRITFELTETALMRDFDAAIVSINLLRGLGIAIALDDFGMGYSSLSYLNRLPLDKVKVDRSFIADMDENSGRKIIAAILGLCVTLELDCIIEGVETEKQLQQVRDIGYHMAQGYLLARPMPLPVLLGWLADAGANPVRRDRRARARRRQRLVPEHRTIPAKTILH